ncbi:MAG TPA: hypothetical protein VFW53_05280 [Gallionella sp.]|nr:hypothetical protein [Gallionella sp.]
MEINSATATSVAQLVNSQQPAPQTPAATAKPSSPDQSAPSGQPQNSDSAVVKLSAQAQQLNRSEQNVNTQRAETRPQEVAEPPGIQLLPGEEKNNGKTINTYA